jgi:hypothetical protein
MQYSGGDLVAVIGDGLAVREGPSTAYPLVAAERWGEGGDELIGSPYRLSAGEELVIGAGPLAVDGRDWYTVSHTDAELQWIRPGESGIGTYGWIAANDSETEFIRLVVAASDAGVRASGVGPATTSQIPPLLGPGERGFHVWIAHQDPAGACDLTVTDNTGAVLLETSLIGWSRGYLGDNWPGDADRLHIDTDCSWSLLVFRSIY